VDWTAALAVDIHQGNVEGAGKADAAMIVLCGYALRQKGFMCVSFAMSMNPAIRYRNSMKGILTGKRTWMPIIIRGKMG